MKKLFFFYFTLASTTLFAQPTVTVTPMGADYGNHTVTFRVAWNGTAHNNRVWVWVDYCPVEGVTSAATFSPASIGAVTITASDGSVTTSSGNTRGFFVTQNPATVTATLLYASGQFNWCAHGSDAPPNVTASNGTYTFRGTPPFILTDASGTITQTVIGNTLLASALTVTPVSLTDRTGYPGVFCIYTGSDLYIDATHLCQQRPSGAANWEAYIKDSRDNQIYRIVQMPTNTWWMADDLLWDGKPHPDATNYTVRGTPRSCDAHTGCGRFYLANATGSGAYIETASERRTSDVCPSGWLIPSREEASAYILNRTGYTEYLSSLEPKGLDTYGLSLYVCTITEDRCGTTFINYVTAAGNCCLYISNPLSGGACYTGGAVQGDGRTLRCVRDL
jgi:hypothetical protein